MVRTGGVVTSLDHHRWPFRVVRWSEYRHRPGDLWAAMPLDSGEPLRTVSRTSF